jgi:AbrB family looped-hinge helix DNA binding protein
MSKVTSKLQVTVPKAIAEQYGIEPGDEITWVPAGDTIRVLPPGYSAPKLDLETRLRLFDEATERQKEREKTHPLRGKLGNPDDRGWTRDDLYAERVDRLLERQR